MYPDDNEFIEQKISKVVKFHDGFELFFEDRCCFFVKDSKIIPKEGMTARLYSNGLGYAIRGLFIDGIEIFYRTKEQDNMKKDIDLYGKDAVDWLNRWDKDDNIWSIEMGGIGPGYEQAIQITMAEILRILIENKFDYKKWEDENIWKKDSDVIDTCFKNNKKTKKLGLSGAQYGAAMSLAIKMYSLGPIAIMKDSAVKDRHIQVQRTFPQL